MSFICGSETCRLLTTCGVSVARRPRNVQYREDCASEGSTLQFFLLYFRVILFFYYTIQHIILNSLQLDLQVNNTVIRDQFVWVRLLSRISVGKYANFVFSCGAAISSISKFLTYKMLFNLYIKVNRYTVICTRKHSSFLGFLPVFWCSYSAWYPGLPSNFVLLPFSLPPIWHSIIAERFWRFNLLQ